MKKILKSDFFARDTELVARSLLGKMLVRKRGNKIYRDMITETEAYCGSLDRASHAYRGETNRNSPMFGPPGIFYIYLVYGIHNMLNVVTESEGYPAAVLIRGIKGISGPGRVTKFLDLGRDLNGRVANKETNLWFEESGILFRASEIEQLPRIGVDFAGEEWALKPLRYKVKGSHL